MAPLDVAVVNVSRPLSRWLPQGLRWRWHRLRGHRRLVAEQGLAFYARWSALRALLEVRNAIGERAYTRLTSEAVAARRRSDTVFVFGSGYSLNDLSEADWRHFAAHDVFGFSGFIYQRWIRVDFHLVRGWDEGPAALRRWRSVVEAYARRLRENSHFNDTILILQNDYGNCFANALVGCRLLAAGTRLCRYRTARRLDDLPSRRWLDGLTHGPGTLTDAVNAAYLLGWKNIVLVGVDLYDSRYFWGPPDGGLAFGGAGDFNLARNVSDRGIAWNEPHNSARNGTVGVLGVWRRVLREEGVELSVFNPRSLLASVLPVYACPSGIVNRSWCGAQGEAGHTKPAT